MMLSTGLEMKTNKKIGAGLTIRSLKEEYDAVFLAVGAQLSKRLDIEGIDLEGVLWGLEFLREVKLGKEVVLKDSVVVIGGGNVAIDVCLTALRSGAKDVQLVCLESREEMPAFDWEIGEALEEGVGIHPSWGPKRVIGEAGNVKGIELMRCTSVFDDELRFNPSFDPDVTKTFDTDTVIFAIGQSSDLGLLDDAGIDSARGLLKVDKDSLETSVMGIFAGGEVVSGPASVIDSIALGKKAASSIDRRLGGDGEIDERFVEPEKINPWLGRENGFADRTRPAMPTLPVEERLGGFEEIELGFDEETARKEAGRCLRCDLRLSISPVVLPPEKWLEFDLDNVKKVPQAEGVYQLLDENKNVIYIAGREDMQKAMEEQLETNEKARYFGYEEEKMYTKRESELLQQHLQRHGRMPELNDELEDLF